MTPAEKRVKELIDRWLTSLDLHLGYVDLKDSAYNNVQPWPVHDRPSRWILELAKQKTLELQAAFDSRLSMGDAKFADSVELIVFLSNLVGIQHVQRFIPLANPESHGQGTLTELDGLKPVKPAATLTPTKVAPAQPAASQTTAQAISSSSTTIEATVAMPTRVMPQVATPTPPTLTVVAEPPQFKAKPAPAAKDNDDATREMPRPLRAPQAVAAQPNKEPAPAAKVQAGTKDDAVKSDPVNSPIDSIEKLIVGDAVRLLNWGRSWHELAELVARIADRPKVAEVRRILRVNRGAIEARIAADAEQAAESKPTTKPKK